MSLQQVLKLNEVGIAVYSKNIFLGYKNVYTPTPEELDKELEAEARKEAIKEITAIKKAEIIAKRIIVKD